MQQRCQWADNSVVECEYHDHEWGVPVHDDRRLFEFRVLEGMQAGLSWATVLRKRDNFRLAFADFDPHRVACFGQRELEVLLSNPGLIRNRQKLHAAVNNARVFLTVQNRWGSFDSYIWRFVGGRPIHNVWHLPQEVPAATRESAIMSKELKSQGFRFVGATICYAFMQAVGMVNDHTTGCFRYSQVTALAG
jgi:DNA-3-methyladenine glycosylase I